MEQKYKSLSLFEFQEGFRSEEDCLKHLAELKWAKGYKCKKCRHQKSCQGYKKPDRQCPRCHYCESPTAGTLFHKVKFSLLKAFCIVYFVGTNKKGITSTELSRKLELRQKTCWLFKRKVIKAMESSGRFPLGGEVEVDETHVGQQEEGVSGRQESAKKLVVLGIEKKGKGVSPLYARVIKNADAKSLGSFLQDHVSKEALFENLLSRMVTAKPCSYKNISTQYLLNA